VRCGNGSDPLARSHDDDADARAARLEHRARRTHTRDRSSYPNGYEATRWSVRGGQGDPKARTDWAEANEPELHRSGSFAPRPARAGRHDARHAEAWRSRWASPPRARRGLPTRSSTMACHGSSPFCGEPEPGGPTRASVGDLESPGEGARGVRTSPVSLSAEGRPEAERQRCRERSS